MSLLLHPRLAPVRRIAGAYAPPRMALKRGADRAIDTLGAALGRTAHIDALADAAAPVDVVVTGIYVTGAARFPQIVEAIAHTRHRVRFALGTMAAQPAAGLEDVTVVSGLTAGKFPNVDAALAADSGPPARWTIVIDSDVRLPERFLDRFVALAEAFDLAIAGPALTLRSYFSHPLTRRRPGSLVRETRFVEIGPVTAFRDDAAALLLPFTGESGMGWGLDWHWPAVAAEHGLKMGVVDATPIGHEDAPFGTNYSTESALREAAARGAGSSISRDDALRTVATHRRLPAAH